MVSFLSFLGDIIKSTGFTGGEFYSSWKMINCVPCDNAFVVIFLEAINNEAIIRFGFVISGIIKVSVNTDYSGYHLIR